MMKRVCVIAAVLVAGLAVAQDAVRCGECDSASGQRQLHAEFQGQRQV